jgi:hypothetical protein
MKWSHWTNAFATHQPVLYEAATRVSKPVIEFGAGEGSTRMLHEICAERGLELVTLDSDAEWLDRYRTELTTPTHSFRLVEDWNAEIDEAEQRDWGLIFIDQGSWEARAETAKRLAHKADYLIVHDCDALPGMGLLGTQIRPVAGPQDTGQRDYGDVFSSWREFFPPEPWPLPQTGPPTLLASNRHDVTTLPIDYSRNAPPRILQRAERITRGVAARARALRK